jgi:UDP-N-acetylglucosamine 4-epimerase
MKEGAAMGYETIRFSKDSTFLVTGAAGFIGSGLTEALLRLGVRVKAMDNYSAGKRENLAAFTHFPGLELIEGDLCDAEVCRRACIGVDYVLHQAALGSVPRSIKFPLLYETNNIQGTLNIFEAARSSGSVRRVVYASSSSVYGDAAKLPKIEGEEGRLLSPYAVTKYVNELYGQLYTGLYHLECIGLRYFNVFGPRQDPHSQYAAVIPIFARQLLAGQAPTIYGDGETSRDFTYIENVVEANLKACLAPAEACGQAFNIAYGQRFTLNEVYRKMCETFGVRIEPVYGPERPGDIRHSLADISKARRLLDYDPSWSFERGFEQAAAWYKQYLGRECES